MGLALRAAYCVLALAIAALGVALYRGSIGPRRSAAAPLLFTVSALGLATVAIGDSWLPEATPLLAPFIHGLAANTAFLCACVGMLLQAWYLRREPGWQPAADLLWGWAWLALCCWLHVLARWATARARTESGDRSDRRLASVPGDGPVSSQPPGRGRLNPNGLRRYVPCTRRRRIVCAFHRGCDMKRAGLGRAMGVVLALATLPATAAVTPQQFSHGRFEQIPVHMPAGTPQRW